MSGHNKWSQIKRKKAVLDSRRGKYFTKALKEITVAVKEGGGDQEGNARLRLAIQNAKGLNCPKDNIERAIKKGLGNDGANYVETTYEGYAPGGIALFVEAATDNTFRTVQDVRAAFNKYGGSLGTNGSLEFIFHRKGVFTFPAGELEEEGFTLDMIDAGAEEVEFSDGYATVTCAKEDFGKLQKALEKVNITPENAELQRIPITLVKVDDEQLPKIMKLIEALEDNDDVQKVYNNMELSESQMEML